MMTINPTTTVYNGNCEITLTITNVTEWERNGNAREYYEISSSDCRNPIRSLYLVRSGTTRDTTIEIDGHIYGFEFSSDVNSKTKRECALFAVKELLEQVEKQFFI